MAAFTYIARRGLIAGHTAGNQYSIDIAIQRYEPVDEIDGRQVLTDSTAETVISATRTVHRFTTVPVDNVAMLAIREFLLSANDGVDITFDVYGTSVSPINPRTGKLKFKKNIKPTQPAHKLYQYEFEIIEFV